jgi:hypothetical protein
MCPGGILSLVGRLDDGNRRYHSACVNDIFMLAGLKHGCASRCVKVILVT